MCLSLQSTLFLENELSFALKLYFSQVNFYRNCNPLAEFFWHKLFYYCSNQCRMQQVLIKRDFLQQSIQLVHSTHICFIHTTATLLAHEQNQTKAPNCDKLFDTHRLDCCGKVSSKHLKSRLKALQTWITSEWSSPSVRTEANLIYCELKQIREKEVQLQSQGNLG